MRLSIVKQKINPHHETHREHRYFLIESQKDMARFEMKFSSLLFAQKNAFSVVGVIIRWECGEGKQAGQRIVSIRQ